MLNWLCARIRETANWRRLERFAFRGIGGSRIPTLNGPICGRYLIRTAPSLKGTNIGIRSCAVVLASATPYLTACSGRFGLPGSPPWEVSHHPIELVHGVAARVCAPRCVGPGRSSAQTETGDYHRRRRSIVEAGYKVCEHWRRLTSRGEEPGQPVDPENPETQ